MMAVDSSVVKCTSNLPGFKPPTLLASVPCLATSALKHRCFPASLPLCPRVSQDELRYDLKAAGGGPVTVEGRDRESTVSQLRDAPCPFSQEWLTAFVIGCRHSDTSPDASETMWIIPDLFMSSFHCRGQEERRRAIHQSAENHSRQQLLIWRKLELLQSLHFL